MVNDNVIAWVEALESGEFQQTTGALCEVKEDGTESFCCLGVASELAYRAGIIKDKSNPPGEDFVEYNGEGGVLPADVAHYLGIAEMPQLVVANPDYNHSMQYEWLDGPEGKSPQRLSPRWLLNTDLAHLNDHGLTFSQIADLIRWFDGDFS